MYLLGGNKETLPDTIKLAGFPSEGLKTRFLRLPVNLKSNTLITVVEMIKKNIRDLVSVLVKALYALTHTKGQFRGTPNSTNYDYKKVELGHLLSGLK